MKIETAGVYSALAQGLVYLKVALSWIMGKKMHTIPRVMETNPPGANPRLSNLAPSYSYSVKANNATLLFWAISNVKSNTMMVFKVHETFDFTDIESVTILCFYLKVSKKTVVLIRTRENLLSGYLFSGKVGGRLPNKKGKRTGGWSQVKPEFAKIKVEQKRVNVVLQDL